MHTFRRIWFVSDLHLDPHHPDITNQFIELLDSSDALVEDIYLLGDVFETWIGDDEKSQFIDEITQKLHQTTQKGVRIHFMRGNRDFLVGHQFLANTGCRRLADEVKIDAYGTAVLLMHGDTLCTQDTAYLRARKFAHNKIVQTLFLWLPLSLRKKIAARARQASAKHTGNTKTSIMDVTQSEVERIMQKHQVNYLIHGHTHRPDIHHFNSANQNKTRIVLPAWHGGGTVFEWREDGSKDYRPLAGKE